jgi:LmbE family N-acetylglucosaminyl deacetylase
MRFTHLFGAIAILAVAFGALQSAPPAAGQSTSGRTLLAVFAHPDDEAVVSPVLAKYAAEGVAVHLAVATDGRLGAAPHSGIPAGDRLAAVRAEELRCAAEKLGIQPPVLFGLHDQMKMGEGLAALQGQIKVLREEIRNLFVTLKPDAVITWGASGWTGHVDHRLVGSVVTEVFESQAWEKPARLYYPALPAGSLPAGSPMELATVDQRYLTVRVPVSEGDYEKARASWLCHKSQYTQEQVEGMHRLIKASLKGTAYFRPLVPENGSRSSLF